MIPDKISNETDMILNKISNETEMIRIRISNETGKISNETEKLLCASTRRSSFLLGWGHT